MKHKKLATKDYETMDKFRLARNVSKLQKQNLLLKFYGLISTTMLICSGTVILSLGVSYMTEANENASIHKDYDTLTENYNVAVGKITDLSNSLTGLFETSKELNDENIKLAKSNEEYYAELTDLRARKELYDKYDYALVDGSGNRTDITYDQLIKLGDLLSDKKVNDEDLILAWIMTESGGKENAKNPASTAKGYGQILDGTAKFTYNNLLETSDKWDASKSLDGDTNMEMMVELVNYLYNKNKGNLYATIKDYRGINDPAYYKKIDSYLAESGKSINSVQAQLRAK